MIWQGLESFCLDVLSDFGQAIGKGPFGGAQNDVSVKFTSQLFKSEFYNSIVLHFEMDIFETVQGYLTHKKQSSPRTLPKNYAKAPVVVLGGGGCFL